VIALSFISAGAGAHESTGGTGAEVTPAAQIDAESRFREFVSAYQGKEYLAQWRIVDPRKRYWVRADRWRKSMQQSRRRHGALVDLSVTHVLPVDAEQIPCTEMGHCFRKGVTYVLLMLRSRYERKQVPQPEFAVMSMSEEGWRWAGGTFPATALGETAVLLDDADEKRFRAIQRSQNQ
jgi:hypothetical protein